MSKQASGSGQGQNVEEMMAVRLNVINEIIATERMFVNDLSMIMEVSTMRTYQIGPIGFH